MGQQIRIFGYILAISLIVGYVPSFGQGVISPKNEAKLGTISFKDRSTKLTKEAKEVLDTFVGKIQSDSTMQVRAVSSSKDLCDKCSRRSWKRTEVILKYLSKHGISAERLVFENRLQGESNKVDIFLIPLVEDSLHPNVKKQ